MSKKWTRRGVLGLLGTGAGLLAWDSRGSTNISADRETDVNVTSDSQALLGIETFDGQLVFETETRDLVELTNNTGETLDTVSVSVTNGGALPFDVDITDTPDSLDPGESGTVSARITGCGSTCEEETGPVELEIFVSSAAGSVSEIAGIREVALSCVNCLTFQTPTTVTPSGFVPDAGDAFGPRTAHDPRSTLEYGWSRDQTTETRERNTVPETEEDTLNHFVREDRIPGKFKQNKNDGYWEFDLDAGEYDVTMRCHDPDYLDQEYSFDVSGGTDTVQLRDSEFDNGDKERTTNGETYEFTIQVDPNEVLSIIPPKDTYNSKITWLRFEADSDPSSPDPANFEATVTDYDDPVNEGEDGDVDVYVENTGDVQDTQTVELNVDDDQDGTFDVAADDRSVTLGGGKTESFTLTYTTQAGDAPEVDFEVTSEQDREERTTTVTVPELSSAGATDIVPNADDQQQTFAFTLGERLSTDEQVTVTVEDNPGEGVLEYDSTGVDDEGQGGEVGITENSDSIAFEYGGDTEIAADTRVEIRTDGMVVGAAGDHSDPYSVTFERSDATGNVTTEFDVSRGTGESELTNVAAEDLLGTDKQTQDVMFVPTTEMAQVDGTDEMLAIDLTDGYELYEGDAAVAGVTDGTASLNTDGDQAWIEFEAAGGISSGTVVTITLEDVEPPATGDTYELGFSRGAADTESATFRVDAPPTFVVTVDDFDDEVLEGDTVDVGVTVENTGDVQDTQTVELNVDDDQDGSFHLTPDDTQVTLASGETTSFTLSYTTKDGDAPGIDFEVTSDQDREERSVTVETLDLSGTDATDIVPNVDQQQQTFEFTFDEALSSAETATITLENAPQDDSVLDHNNEGVVDDGGKGGSIDLDQSGTDVVFTYADGESIPAGTSVELRVPQIDVGSETDQSDPYDFVFGRSDNAGTRSIPVEVSRDTGQGELQNVEASDLVGTVPQTQEITFTPTTDMVGIESVDELVSVDLTDALDLYGNASVTSVSNATLDALDVRSDAAFIRVNADGGVSAGTEIVVTLEDVEPPATGDTYELGFSRGAADTKSATFSVDAPPNFAVTVDSFDDEVLEGDTVDVDVTVENTGDLQDTQTVELNVDDDQDGTFDVAADAYRFTLAGGDSESFTLSYTTKDGDAPGIDFEVTSDQDREERSATVNVPMADVVEVDENGGWTFDTTTGQTGVAFDITNGSSTTDVVVTEVGVDSGSAGNTTVIEVRNGSSVGEFGVLQSRDSNTNYAVVLLDLGGGSLAVQENNTTGLNTNLTLQPGDSEPVGANEFRDINDKPVNMNKSGGGDATVRLVFQDGSEDTYAFQSLPNKPP